MLEDITITAAQTLVQLFWLIILTILIFGTLWIKTTPNKTKH
jgi:hypothetical protein